MDLFSLGFVLTGLIVAIFYTTIAIKNSNLQKESLFDCSMLFLSVTSIYAGIKIIIFSYNPELQKLAAEEKIGTIYLILAGFTVIWIGLFAVVKIFDDFYNKLGQKDRDKNRVD